MRRRFAYIPPARPVGRSPFSRQEAMSVHASETSPIAASCGAPQNTEGSGESASPRDGRRLLAAVLRSVAAWLCSPGGRAVLLALLAFGVAFAMRMLEYPAWQTPEYQLDGEYLLATHDAYHWTAGADGFEFGTGHPMSELVRYVALLTGATSGAVGFWLPPVMGSLLAVAVFAWAAALGGMEAGLCAGVLASLAPGFLARTLLGYCDTDLVTLLFALVSGLGPGLWLAPRLHTLPELAVALYRRLRRGRPLSASAPPETPDVTGAADDPLSPRWMVVLLCSGLLGWWSQEWHSMFPYLVRYYALLVPGLVVVFGMRGRRADLLVGGLLYALPALGGWPGFAGAALLAVGLRGPWPFLRALAERRVVHGLLWLVVLWLVADAEVFQTMLRSAQSYVKRAGDAVAQPDGDVLVYPSVAQSIIEVQDLSLAEVLAYFHPWMPAALAGLAGFGVALVARPAALFHLPLAVLAFLSIKLGGRMVMFGAPVMALGICMPVHWLAGLVLRDNFYRTAGRLLVSAVLLTVLGAPYLEVIPAMTQGPILNKRHAAALKFLRTNTPEDSMIWNWWDWGYATHHFAHRSTIADGASHGGPSLFVPAAVYASDNPRFARQLIKYAASKGNIPGNVFEGMNNHDADDLMRKLAARKEPLVAAQGRQYLVVSFDMLRLGFWITTYGRWDFLAREGRGYQIASISKPLQFSMENGVVLVQNMDPVYAESIDVLDDTGLNRQMYFRFNGRHFLFNRTTGDKLVIDDDMYNTLMVQLLLSSPEDPRFTPYFKLVFDNVHTRVYEVL
nr:oligosaccharyltransferase PglB [Nitratidesulfovibrio sp. HK-II]